MRAGPRHIFQLLAGTYQLTRTGTITGGGLNLTGTIDILGAGAGQTFINQLAPQSRVIEIDGGSILISDLNITGGSNSNGFEGAGIFNQGTLVLRRSVVSGNSTSVAGGGLSNVGAATVISTVVRDNHAGTGGGIRNSGSLTVRDSALYSNFATTVGGLDNTGTAELANTSVIANFGGGGGGIRVLTGGRLQLSNATVARNLAGAGGAGIRIETGTVITVMNSIIAENDLTNGLRDDCHGVDLAAIDVMLFSFLGQSDAFCLPAFSFFNQIGNPGVITPSFGTLNSGVNPRLPLAFTSPLLDAGDPNGCCTHAGVVLLADQAGVARPDGARCDPGAVEFVTVPILRVFLPRISR